MKEKRTILLPDGAYYIGVNRVNDDEVQIEFKIAIPKESEDVNIKVNKLKSTIDIIYTNITDEERKKDFLSDEWLNTYFPVVELSNLSLEDEFMKHKPKTENEKDFKERITKVIKDGIKDIRIQRLDPSFDRLGRIIYKKGEEPAICKSNEWWEENAKKFLPEKNSRLGTFNERIAFLGVIIKRLMESGWKCEKAWNVVCNKSKDIGYFFDSEESFCKLGCEPAYYMINYSKVYPKDNEPKKTGTHHICGFYDLANTHKILINNNFLDKKSKRFEVLGGDSHSMSYRCPLSEPILFSNDIENGVGWIILEKID